MTKNEYVGPSDWLILLDSLKLSSRAVKSHSIYAKNNYVGDSDLGFTGLAGGIYDFNKKSQLSRLKVLPIDTSLIGLYLDEFRAYVLVGTGGTQNP